jgi:Tol biopolymer transport system component
MLAIMTTLRSTLMLRETPTQVPKQISKGGDDGAMGVSIRRHKIAYASALAGYPAVWVTNTSGTAPVQVTPADQIAASYMSLSPDGNYLAYFAWQKSNGQTPLWIANSDGTNSRPLTEVHGFIPGFSADGHWVYYQHRSEGAAHLFKVPVAGGEPVQVTGLQITSPGISYRGDRMLARYYDEKLGQWRLGVISLADGKVLQVLDLTGGGATGTVEEVNGVPKWLPADDGVAYVETRDQVSNLWSLSLENGRRRQVTHFSEPADIFDFDMDSDGTLVVSRGHVDSDAVLIRNFH